MALTDGLVAWWEMEEASGVRSDSHTNSLDLIDNNTVASMVGHIGSYAADFVSDNTEYLSNSDALLTASDQMTIAFWIYNGGAPPAANIIGRYTGSGATLEWLVYSSGTTLHFYVARTTGVIDDLAAGSPVHNSASPGWNFVVLEINVAAGTESIYVDNGAGASKAHTSQRKNATDFRIGGGMAFPFDGGMDTVAIWNRVLTSDERTELWNSGAGVTYASIAAAVPADPTSLTLVAGLTTVDLTWVDNSDDETGFKVERSLTGSSGWTLLDTTAADATTYSDTGLAPNTTYYYRVSATNAEGDSGYATANATTDAYVSDPEVTWTPPARARTFTPPTRDRTWTPPTRARKFTLP